MHYLHHKVSSHIFQAFDFTLDEAGKTAKDVSKPPSKLEEGAEAQARSFLPAF